MAIMGGMPSTDASTEVAALAHATAEPCRTNWAGNYLYQAAGLREPGSAEEVATTVRALPRVKALGARHSFNHIADTEGVQISLRGLRGMRLDREAGTVTVGAGVTYGELAPWLDALGFAVHNLASLPHISVVGACATGTHGSGIGNGCLSTAVRGLELIDGRGERRRLRLAEDAEAFRAAVVGLGALGVVTEITLAVEPAFDVAQTVYEGLHFGQLAHSARAIFSAGYSVSLFTDWQEHRATQVWVKRRVGTRGAVGGASATQIPFGNDSQRSNSNDDSHSNRTGGQSNGSDGAFLPVFFGAVAQTVKLHPLPGLDAENCTEQMGIPGPWYERLPHFRNDYTPSSGAELQTEYFVPFEQAYEAVLAVEALRDRISPLLLVSELRAVAADDLPMSMAYARESLAFHFTWRQEMEAVRALLPALEEKLAPFEARPHWAKLFAVPAGRVRELYPRFGAFRETVKAFDPEGRFRNAYLEEALGA